MDSRGTSTANLMACTKNQMKPKSGIANIRRLSKCYIPSDIYRISPVLTDGGRMKQNIIGL